VFDELFLTLRDRIRTMGSFVLVSFACKLIGCVCYGNCDVVVLLTGEELVNELGK
jgi:hypothetical protein